MLQHSEQLNVAIACGGTGGHLFPGLAVAGELVRHGVNVTLMISPKEVDQLAVKAVTEMRVVTLPAVGLTRGQVLRFLRGFWQAYRTSCRSFAEHPPQAVLAMGGFTSASPILAARSSRACTFLHESNTIPGRANRWLSRVVDRVFVGFPSASGRLNNRQVSVTGTPVRARFQLTDPGVCRSALGLEPARPVALVMGGSQGAHGINELILKSMELLAQRGPDWQWVHLAGPADVPALTNGYRKVGLAAKIYPFFPEVELAMGAATTAVSRAGASSLAELAAMRLPSVLIPFPAATDNHQFHNARAFEQTGAARLVEQRTARPQDFVKCFGDLMCEENSRHTMREALAGWHKPHAAEEIARAVLDSILSRRESTNLTPSKSTPSRKKTEPDKSSRSQDQRSISPTMQTLVNVA